MNVTHLKQKAFKRRLVNSVSKYLLAFMLSCSIQVQAEERDLEDASRDDRLSIMERVAQKNLGRDVAFDYHPYFFGLTGVRLDNFKISEGEEYYAEHPYLSPWAMRAESVDVRYNPFAIFIGRISVKKFEMIRPQVQFSIDGLNRTNFDDLIERQKKNRFSNWFRTHHMIIKDMQMDIFSELLSAQPIQYKVEDINVDIRNLIKKKVAPISITAKTPGSYDTNVNIEGTIGPIVSIARIEDSPMDIKFRVKNAPLDFELAKLPDELMQDKLYRRTLALPESGFGHLAFDFVGDSLNGLVTTGKINLSNMVLASIDKQLRGIPFNINMDIKTHFSLNKQLAELEQFYIDMNNARIIVDGKVTNIIDNPTAALTLKSTGMDMLKFNNIYPFVSANNGIKPIGGEAFLDFEISGDQSSGYNLTGRIGLDQMQLATLDEKSKGKQLNANIDLNDGIKYYSHRNEVKFDRIDLNIANTTFQVAGNIKNATQIERELTATIKSETVDIKAVHDFFPFYDKYLPSNVVYDGSFSFTAEAKGAIDHGKIEGKADLSNLTFLLPNFFNKQKRSPFDVSFTAEIDNAGDIEAGIAFTVEDGTLDQASIYYAAVKHLLGGERLSRKAKKYLSALDKETIYFEKSTGTIKTKDLESADITLQIHNLTAGAHQNVNMSLEGRVAIEDFSINLAGEIVFPKASYDAIIAINAKAKRYVLTRQGESDDSLVLPIVVKGSVSEPTFEATPLVASYSRNEQ